MKGKLASGQKRSPAAVQASVTLVSGMRRNNAVDGWRVVGPGKH